MKVSQPHVILANLLPVVGVVVRQLANLFSWSLFDKYYIDATSKYTHNCFEHCNRGLQDACLGLKTPRVYNAINLPRRRPKPKHWFFLVCCLFVRHINHPASKKVSQPHVILVNLLQVVGVVVKSFGKPQFGIPFWQVLYRRNIQIYPQLFWALKQRFTRLWSQNTKSQ